MTDWYVLYCLLNINKDLYYYISLIKRDYFNNILALSIFDYINELLSKNIKPTLELINSRFSEESEKIYLDCGIDVNNIEEYIENQRKNYLKKEISKFGKEIINCNIEEEDFLSKTNNILNVISSYKNDDNIGYIDNIIDNVLKKANREEIEYHKVLTGLEDVDNWFLGLPPGALIYIAGRPSMGKSGLIAEIAKFNVLNGLVSIVFSLEMSKENIVERMLCSEADIELWKLKSIKNRNEREQNKIIEVAHKLKKSALIIDTSPLLTINTMKSTIQKTILKYGRIDLILLDYLQLMNGEGNNDNSKIANISRNLKIMSNTYNCPVIAGSQLSRLCEQRENKRPILSDMRDSGTIEQDADIVMMCYREVYYSSNPEHEKIFELIIKKNRNGEIGKILLEYDKYKQQFKTMNFNSKLGQSAKKFLYL